jgi:transposase
MHSALRAMRNKTDRNDAHGIAQTMHMGWFRAALVKSPETRRLKIFLANRRLLKRKLINPQNHLGGALRTYDLKVGAPPARRLRRRDL